MPIVKGSMVQVKLLVLATFMDLKAPRDLKMVTPKDPKVVTSKDPKVVSLKDPKVVTRRDLRIEIQGQGTTLAVKPKVALRAKVLCMETGLQQRRSTLMS